MTIRKIFSLCAVAGLSFTFSTASVAADSPELMVYAFEELPRATLEQTAKQFKHFLPGHDANLQLNEGESLVRFVSEKDVNTTFEYNVDTHDVSFQRNFDRYLGDFVPRLPEGDKAVEIALQFLEENRLMPENPEELTVAHVGGLRSTSLQANGKPGPVVDKLKTVTLARQLKGAPVIGPASKMVINIGDKGEIIGAVSRWREFEKGWRLDPNQVLQAGEAKELAYQQSKQEFGEKSEIEFYDMQVAYFDNNGKYLQPVYAFQAKIQLPNSDLEPVSYVSIVEAMREPVERLNLLAIDERALKLIESADGNIPEEPGKGSD